MYIYTCIYKINLKNHIVQLKYIQFLFVNHTSTKYKEKGNS